MQEVCKIMSTLPHGQSSVERGFMVNKQFSIENLKEISLIALHQVTDHISASEKPKSDEEELKVMEQKLNKRLSGNIV